MNGIKLKFNEKDIERILGRLNRTLARSATYQFKWRLDLLNEYRQTVRTAMGTLNARGGYPLIRFEKNSGIGHWNALRPSTIKAKMKRRGVDVGDKNPKEIYEAYATKLTIWLDTGQTKGSVVVHGNFAGIESSSALEKAHTVEEGDDTKNIAKRPLFAVANYLIINTIHTMLANDDSWLAKAIRQEFVDLAVKSGWGS